MRDKIPIVNENTQKGFQNRWQNNLSLGNEVEDAKRNANQRFAEGYKHLYHQQQQQQQAELTIDGIVNEPRDPTKE